MKNKINSLIGTDSPLTEGQYRTLVSILNLIIPASEEFNMPAASVIDILSHLREMESSQAGMIGNALTVLDSIVVNDKVKGIHSMKESDREKCVAEFADLHPELWQLLVQNTMVCYYQNEQVLAALGMNSQPYPKGNEFAPSDLSLLDPVRQREKFYRE